MSDRIALRTTLTSVVVSLLTLVAAAALPIRPILAAETSVSDEAREIAAAIRGRQLAGRVRFLASSYMEGREAGTRGERLASEYLRDFYVGLGLSPAGDDGSFFQNFDLHRVELGDGNAFAVSRGEGQAMLHTDYPLEDGFVPFNFSPSARVDAPVVFAGYGIRSEEHGYDDYKGLDVAGRIVLVLRHEPRENDPDSPFNGLRATRHASFLSKVRLAQAQGALGLLLVTDPLGHGADRRSPGNSLARWSSLTERGEFDLRPPPEPTELYPEIAPDVRIPALHISFAAAEDLLAGSGPGLAQTQRAIDEAMQPASRALDGVGASITIDIRRERVPVRNVAAKIEGSDPALKDEYVVIGGHYDHVGYGHFGSIGGLWGKLHPGADDNASGTVAVMSAAEAIVESAYRPQRSLLFLHFTAEEKGLLGSRWYTDHPSVPLDRMIAMLNLDMVGRNEPNVLSIVGDRRAAGLDALIKGIGGAELGMTINNDAGSGIDRSDQWPFARQKVPAIAFFSGTHDEYHRPGDVASLIVVDKLENVTRLGAMTLWEIAERGREAIAVDDGDDGLEEDAEEGR